MSEFPERIQIKISSYTAALSSRFPTGKTFYRISVGYSTGQQALDSTTPFFIIYTNDDLDPDAGSRIYIDQLKKNTFGGKNLYYHVFNSSDVSLEKAIQIDNDGNVINIFTGKN
jgi:hypothetical protein